MVRILAVVLWIAVTIYAIADWARTPDDEVPGRIGRMWWLTIIVITMPFISIGSIVWILLRTITRAESGETTGLSDLTSESNPLRSGWSQRPDRSQSSQRREPLAPDDDPDFLFRLERDIQRRRREQARNEEAHGDHAKPVDSDSSSPDEPGYRVPPAGSTSVSDSDQSDPADSFSEEADATEPDSDTDADPTSPDSSTNADAPGPDSTSDAGPAGRDSFTDEDTSETGDPLDEDPEL